MILLSLLLWFIWKIVILVEFLWYYCKNGKNGKLDVPIGQRFSDKLWNCIFSDYNNQFMFLDSDNNTNFYESVSFGDTFRR